MNTSQDYPQSNLIKHYLNFFADQYSKLSSSISSITAVSDLEQNKQLLESKHEKLALRLDQISEMCFTGFASSNSNSVFNLVDRKLFSEVKFPISTDVNQSVFDDFVKMLKPYHRESLVVPDSLIELFDIYLKERICNAQLLTCSHIIDTILNLGYPEKLSLSDQNIDDLSKEISKSKVGRPPDIPDSTAEKILTDALQNAKAGKANFSKFIKKNDSPNIRQLAIHLSEKGHGTDLELRSLQRTVKRVLEEYDIINSVMS